ncbi:unnamed protein product [Prorocentrum cordatum]|uniref:protein-tyrosine-phosphatase n=1 Tax=Prorocentrum cordatum TaxID=2364126 RepID=A0ABN9RWM5_9DINO|nr:unnamed protein product [Polarella glacialis]
MGAANLVDVPDARCRERPASSQPLPDRGVEAGPRAARAARRQRDYGGEPATDELGPTALAKHAARGHRGDRCERAVSQFDLWRATAVAAIDPTWQLDAAVTALLHEQFLEGPPSFAGACPLAALARCRLDLSPKSPDLARARRATLLGLARAAPRRSRWPLPRPLAALVASAIVDQMLGIAAAATPLCLWSSRARDLGRPVFQAAVVVGLGAPGPPEMPARPQRAPAIARQRAPAVAASIGNGILDMLSIGRRGEVVAWLEDALADLDIGDAGRLDPQGGELEVAAEVGGRPATSDAPPRPLDNCDRVLPLLYLGGLESTADVQRMVREGICAVVCCMREFEFPSSTFSDQLLDYFRVDVEDVGREPIEAFIPEALAFVHARISRGQAVLVHCRAGVSRSTVVVIAYLVVHQGRPHAAVAGLS